MTYIVSGEALNSTHSLTHSQDCRSYVIRTDGHTSDMGGPSHAVPRIAYTLVAS